MQPCLARVELHFVPGPLNVLNVPVFGDIMLLTHWALVLEANPTILLLRA